MEMAMNTKTVVRRNSCAHVALDIQQRCDPKEAQREDHDALHKVR